MLTLAKWIVDNITSAFGKTNDTGGSATSGTAMAKLNALFSNVSTAVSNTAASTTSSSSGTLSQKLNYVAGLASTAATNASNAASYASSASSNASRGAVKSVQRGTSSFNTNINISSVTPSKCLVILNWSGNMSSSSTGGTYCVSLASTTLNIYFYHGTVSWQVIEFY